MGAVNYRPVGYYTPELPTITAARGAALLRYADLLCDGTWPMFGHGLVQLGMRPNWQQDFVSGKDWSLKPSHTLKAVRHDGSDVKIPWELSRLQFLPVLAKAWRLTGTEAYRETAKRLLSEWIAKNPVGQGINWSIAMEAALRAISICFALELLSPFAEGEWVWLDQVTRSLYKHFLFIEAHSEFSHFTRSNHYLSNIVGLLCLSLYLNGRYRHRDPKLYSRLIQTEMSHQVHTDGGDYESSIGYQILKIQMFTTSLRLMQVAGLAPEAAFVERLNNMYALVASLADSGGCLPHIGDCDDGRVELLVDDIVQMVHASPERHDSLLVPGLMGVGSYLMDATLGGHADDAAWLGQRCELPREPATKLVPSVDLFAESGIAIARFADAELTFVALPNGIDGKGSHTHNDKLSLLLRIRGLDVLVDSGTSCYSRDARRRNLFRATQAHNTVQIDGQEQNQFSDVPSLLFRMGNDANVSVIDSECSPTCIRLSGSHSGYERFGVGHKRTILLRACSALIEDTVTGSGLHKVQVGWHFPGTCSINLDAPNRLRVNCSSSGLPVAQMTFDTSSEFALETIDSDISTCYGRSSPGTMVRVNIHTALPVQLATTIQW
jgi:hypothetical protein